MYVRMYVVCVYVCMYVCIYIGTGFDNQSSGPCSVCVGVYTRVCPGEGPFGLGQTHTHTHTHTHTNLFQDLLIQAAGVIEAVRAV